MTSGRFICAAEDRASFSLEYCKKSGLINLPTVPYSEVDYFRGIIDGDGSLGITEQGIPFLGLVTAGEDMARNYIDYVEKVTGLRIHASRNSRDNVYNLLLTKEKAAKMVGALYYPGCLALDRKIGKAKEVLSWVRPEGSKKREYETKRWTRYEDEYIKTHTLTESCKSLGRNFKSVRMRLWRLKKKEKGNEGANTLGASQARL